MKTRYLELVFRPWGFAAYAEIFIWKGVEEEKKKKKKKEEKPSRDKAIYYVLVIKFIRFLNMNENILEDTMNQDQRIIRNIETDGLDRYISDTMMQGQGRQFVSGILSEIYKGEVSRGIFWRFGEHGTKLDAIPDVQFPARLSPEAALQRLDQFLKGDHKQAAVINEMLIELHEQCKGRISVHEGQVTEVESIEEELNRLLKNPQEKRHISDETYMSLGQRFFQKFFEFSHYVADYIGLPAKEVTRDTISDLEVRAQEKYLAQVLVTEKLIQGQAVEYRGFSGKPKGPLVNFCIFYPDGTQTRSSGAAYSADLFLGDEKKRGMLTLLQGGKK